jgi:hypothetical protein
MQAMTKEDKLERVITPMPATMVKAIAEYRFDARCDTKSEAVRRLIEIGLKTEARRLKKSYLE